MEREGNVRTPDVCVSVFFFVELQVGGREEGAFAKQSDVAAERGEMKQAPTCKCVRVSVTSTDLIGIGTASADDDVVGGNERQG
ncbi:hypothetical protein PHSY_002479 [Pseudozyma hubeiensis SY62]|uniref:Uncharacterized protein n=1 Tax=Pseudozyma hubeiensis (strain SY62) TaxID=1305764 RepID=R9P130_PSEHS|nr:hypothetical protein PHSY_002479 [Pseudozyma hubeiensis SY62]GAC94906.1 hypothetical protein PHSY_002479 [Pseudozyma hubeiensis SY62]